MACGSVTSFESYLSNSTLSFFTNPRNKCSTKCSSVGFLDKILKTADPIFDLAEVIAKSHDAPIHVIHGMGKGREFVRAGRDVTAFFNIFQGIIPNLVQSVKNTIALLGNLCNTTKVNLKEREKDENNPGKFKKLKYNEKAVTEEEKRWALGEQIGKGVAAASFIAGFAICRPIGAYEKYISRDTDPIASKIGKAFPTVMLVNHVSGVVASTCGLVFQQLAYDRETSKDSVRNTKDCFKKVTLEYNKKMLENGVTLAQKVLECISSALLHAGTAVPTWVRIPLNLGAGVLSVTKEWIK